MKLEVADPLAEQVVRLAVTGGDREAVYHSEREDPYKIPDPDAREAAFRGLHRRWFLELGLEEPLRAALTEVPELKAAIGRLSVNVARRAADEGSELYVSPRLDLPLQERRTLLFRLLPATVVDRPRFSWLLRRELLLAADMTDPVFDYRPQLPPSTAGPVHDQLLRDRYALLWSTTVLGRLARRGHAPAGTEEGARGRFERAFPMLGERAAEIFVELFDGQRPTHETLVELARAPAGEAGSRCPCCGFPSYELETAGTLEPEVEAYLRREMPEWRREAGICPRCADMYRVRTGVFGRVSAAA